MESAAVSATIESATLVETPVLIETGLGNRSIVDRWILIVHGWILVVHGSGLVVEIVG